MTSAALLRSVALRRMGRDEPFPFSVPAIRTLDTLDVDAPVTFFVGENGSGKSTLMEAIAIAARLPTVGSTQPEHDRTLDAQRRLAAALALVWRRRTHRGFFLRAEDFFGFAKSLAELRAEMQRQLAGVAEEYRERSAYARGLAELPMRRSLAEMESRYGIDLDANSHGESFLRLFRSRFVPDGLYLLDEPEAALSPRSQLALLAMLADMTARGSQFIVATHSPLLLSYPDAVIYSFDEPPVARADYERLEHVALTREFLADPQRFLRHLLGDRGADA
ncbi:MAG: AAA family ATPase [Gemmatimonadaceae bacterium]|nr:AAA family ATPase [Gemmatimonadaceae bacterium]NUQ92268.1 AAA family ATPase [Gemmatimonadaceae bacterium]NUR18860.1 AAA family ATPase [Gemmatimonadaceae bacterium]NUS98495.1 AAA family ATPase [Gemmatimonadaceae bacterium]